MGGHFVWFPQGKPMGSLRGTDGFQGGIHQMKDTIFLNFRKLHKNGSIVTVV